MKTRKLKKKDKQKIASAYSLVTQLAINVLVIIFGCFFFGKFLDDVFGTSPLLMLFFLILGILSAFRNIYVLSMRAMNIDKNNEGGNNREKE